MTLAEYIAILLQGEDAWNRSRQEQADGAAPDLSGSQLAHRNLDGFDLHGVVLQKAYLRGATLRGACLREADLQSAYLMGADLERAELSRARLVAVNLNGANLTACAFEGADMREADCGGAELCGADFTDADLHGVNLLGANLKGARFLRTRGLSSRQLMAACNWEKAQLQPDIAERLGLPLSRPAVGTTASGGPEPEGGEPLSAAAKRTAPPRSDNRKAMAAGRDSPSSHTAGTGESLRSLACSLDPTLG
jgi:hypothetical protein